MAWSLVQQWSMNISRLDRIAHSMLSLYKHSYLTFFDFMYLSKVLFLLSRLLFIFFSFNIYFFQIILRRQKKKNKTNLVMLCVWQWDTIQFHSPGVHDALTNQPTIWMIIQCYRFVSCYPLQNDRDTHLRILREQSIFNILILLCVCIIFILLSERQTSLTQLFNFNSDLSPFKYIIHNIYLRARDWTIFCFTIKHNKGT